MLGCYHGLGTPIISDFCGGDWMALPRRASQELPCQAARSRLWHTPGGRWLPSPIWDSPTTVPSLWVSPHPQGAFLSLSES